MNPSQQVQCNQQFKLYNSSSFIPNMQKSHIQTSYFSEDTSKLFSEPNYHFSYVSQCCTCCCLTKQNPQGCLTLSHPLQHLKKIQFNWQGRWCRISNKGVYLHCCGAALCSIKHISNTHLIKAGVSGIHIGERKESKHRPFYSSLCSVCSASLLCALPLPS